MCSSGADFGTYGNATSLTVRSAVMVPTCRGDDICLSSNKMNIIFMEVNSMQEKITIYCKRCKKSTRVSHVLTGCDDTPVLPNVQIACTHCTRVITFKKLIEGEMKKNAKGDRFYV